jgi:hypothetical protein
MKTVHVTFTLLCDWQDVPPVYRLYVDDELLTERTYSFKNTDLTIQESMPLKISTGPHYLHVVNVYPERGTFTVTDLKVGGKDRDYRQHDCRFVINPDDLKV